MTTLFSPQLIGETEKTLNALLQIVLDDAALTEPEWVTLRVASQAEGGDLAATVAERAHFANASELVTRLTERGLLRDGRLSLDGRNLLDSLQSRVATMTAPIWHGLPEADVATTARVLNEVLTRAHALLP
jgi:hypothetical protein